MSENYICSKPVTFTYNYYFAVSISHLVGCDVVRAPSSLRIYAKYQMYIFNNQCC